jgi:hypothetical protein
LNDPQFRATFRGQLKYPSISDDNVPNHPLEAIAAHVPAREKAEKFSSIINEEKSAQK